jgi:hypothetical protein
MFCAGRFGECDGRPANETAECSHDRRGRAEVVTYRNADPDVASRLVIKRPSEAPWSRAAAVVEAGFYRDVATLPDNPPVVPACIAATDECLVLADLSPTHAAPVTRTQSIALVGVPTIDALDAAVDVLASLHAYWWRRCRGPFEVAPWWRDEATFDWYAQRRRYSWSRIAGEVPNRPGAHTSPSWTDSTVSGSAAPHAPGRPAHAGPRRRPD